MDPATGENAAPPGHPRKEKNDCDEFHGVDERDTLAYAEP